MKQRAQLPKNIRQVGQKDAMFRIYLEDYVHTFIRRIGETNKEESVPKVGILLGGVENIQGNECWFVDGAIEIDGLWLPSGEIQFTASKWKEIEEERKKYFPESSICGWFIHGKEEAKLDFIVLKQIHRETFANKNSLFLLCRGDEQNFWVGSGTELSASQGYYVFFEQNQCMQDYMVETRKVEKEAIVEERAIKSFRTIMEGKKNQETKTNVKQWYSLLAGVAVVLLAFGIGVSQTGEEPQEPSAHIPVGATNSIEASWDSSFAKEDITLSESSEYVADNATKSSTDETTANINPNDGLTSSQAEEVGGQVNTIKEYVIQPGDTLLYISIDYYGSTDMVKAICLLNGITDPNQLYIGQTIKLP